MNIYWGVTNHIDPTHYFHHHSVINRRLKVHQNYLYSLRIFLYTRGMTSETMRPDIILARHGHSHGNAGNRTHGVADIALTEEGHRQAEVLAQHIVDAYGVENISSIITTPYSRTLQTAQPLLERTGLSPHIMSDMREITYLQPSKADGTTYDERERMRDTFWAASRLDPEYVDEGEVPLDSVRSFLDRVHSALGKLSATFEKDPRLHVVYAHEFPISTALNIAQGKSDEEIIDAMTKNQKPEPRIDNTQAVGLTYRGGKWAIVDDSHADLFPRSRDQQ